MPTNDGSQRSITPSTYNPSANSPIKAPEAKFCITCGQPIASQARPLTNEMSVYVNTISGNRNALNETSDTLTIQGVLQVREGGEAYAKWLAAKNTPVLNEPPQQQQQVPQQSAENIAQSKPPVEQVATKVPAPATPPPTK